MATVVEPEATVAALVVFVFELDASFVKLVIASLLTSARVQRQYRPALVLCTLVRSGSFSPSGSSVG